MRLRLRLLYLLLSSCWKKRLGILDESVITLTVLPNDVDIMKMTNDRYVSLMDLGRMDLIYRSGLLKLMFNNKWAPVATFAAIRFRYPLKVFQKYQLRTSVLWWDEDSFYCQQIFERKGRVLATGYVRASLLRSNGLVPSQDVLSAIGQLVTKPIQPEIVARINELGGLIHESQKEPNLRDA